jgi:hypothetical protein
MTTYYDDNYGKWEGMEGDGPEAEENRAFYRRTQRRNVKKICVDCGRTVWIKKDYECCNGCADMRERGYGL